jgi:hypothetical protein
MSEDGAVSLISARLRKSTSLETSTLENMQRKFADEHYIDLRNLYFVRLIIFMNTYKEVTSYFILSM